MQLETRLFAVRGNDPSPLSVVIVRVAAPECEEGYLHREGISAWLGAPDKAAFVRGQPDPRNFFDINDVTANDPMFNPAYPAPDLVYSPQLGLDIQTRWLHRVRALVEFANNIGTPEDTDIDLNMMESSGFAQVTKVTSEAVQRYGLAVEARAVTSALSGYPVWMTYHIFTASITARNEAKTEAKAKMESFYAVEVSAPQVRHLHQARRAMIAKAKMLGIWKDE